MWDEEPAAEPPPNEPKPPEYEFIMESDMNMFARMKIMDPDMPPPTIRSGKSFLYSTVLNYGTKKETI